MSASTVGFLKQVLDRPGPSGFEAAPARLWREEVKRFADQMEADVRGNSIGIVNPKGKPRLMLAGHIDEIGLQVTHVDAEAYLSFGPVCGGGRPRVGGPAVPLHRAAGGGPTRVRRQLPPPARPTPHC